MLDIVSSYNGDNEENISLKNIFIFYASLLLHTIGFRGGFQSYIYLSWGPYLSQVTFNVPVSHISEVQFLHSTAPYLQGKKSFLM